MAYSIAKNTLSSEKITKKGIEELETALQCPHYLTKNTSTE